MANARFRPAKAGIGRASRLALGGPRQIAAVAVVLVCALCLSLITPMPVRAATVWGPWTGSMSISVHESWETFGPKVASATYTNLELVGAFDSTEDGENGYRADADVSVSIEDESGSYVGGSEGMEAARIVGQAQDFGGVVLRLRDSVDRSETYFAPNDVWVFADGSQGSQAIGGANFYHGFYGGGKWSTGALVDTDPAADRLVGSTTWTMGDYPDNIAPWSDYTGYSYTVSYDLTRSALTGAECADGIDNDGDGQADVGADHGCVNSADASEYGSAECDNGVDDDGNGLTDFRQGGGDPGCSSLSDVTEAGGAPCSLVSDDHHYTVMKAPANLDLALSPDVHLGTLNLGFHWCMTEQGPKIKTVPTAVSNPAGWWESTDNWMLLGALESFAGVTVDSPAEPRVVHGKVTASVETKLKARLNAVEAALSAVPLGKLFGPARKALVKHGKKLDPLAKQLKRHAARVATLQRSVQRASERLRTTTNELNREKAVLAQLEFDRARTPAGLRRTELTREIARTQASVASLQRVQRVYAADLARDQRAYRTARTEEAKAARAVDSVLRQVRASLNKVTNFRAQVLAALNSAVQRVQPAWAREVVREMTRQLVAVVDRAIAEVKSRIREFTSRMLIRAIGSGRATSTLLSKLQDSYRTRLQQASNISVPIWDALFLVSIDQSGQVVVADNSASRFAFTVNSSPTTETSD